MELSGRSVFLKLEHELESPKGIVETCIVGPPPQSSFFSLPEVVPEDVH